QQVLSCRVHFHPANRDAVCGSCVDNTNNVTNSGISGLPPNNACVEHVLCTVTVVNPYTQTDIFGVGDKESLRLTLQLAPLDLLQHTAVNSADVVEQQCLNPKEVSITLCCTQHQPQLASVCFVHAAFSTDFRHQSTGFLNRRPRLDRQRAVQRHNVGSN